MVIPVNVSPVDVPANKGGGKSGSRSLDLGQAEDKYVVEMLKKREGKPFGHNVEEVLKLFNYEGKGMRKDMGTTAYVLNRYLARERPQVLWHLGAVGDKVISFHPGKTKVKA